MPQVPSANNIVTALFDALDEIVAPERGASDHTHTTLVTSLSTTEQAKFKKIMLALHFLFPHELLPALDLLDRHLLKCVQTQRCDSIADEQKVRSESNSLFYVQSASAAKVAGASAGHRNDVHSSETSTGRFRRAFGSTSTHYEVDVDGWNCSCPAFAFNSLKLLMGADHVDTDPSLGTESTNAVEDGSHMGSWKFGGRATREHAVVPVCKHILAAALVVASPRLLGRSVQYVYVSREEFAGWAAGWGEH